MGRARNIQTKICLNKEEREMLDKLVKKNNTTIRELILMLIKERSEKDE